MALNGDKIYEKLDTIDAAVDAINAKVDKLLIWRAEHVTAHELVERDVTDNRAVLFENPGLISKVNTLWNCKSNITERRKFWLDVLKYLIAVGIVGVIAWLLLLYKSV